MLSGAERLNGIFKQELQALRDEAGNFASEYPEHAKALSIQSGRSQDPHVEMLMQSFAYLTGRLRYQQELDQAQLPNALMADLYPHFEGPVPSMTVACIHVEVNGQKYGKGVFLKRESQVSANIQDDRGNILGCYFRTAWESMLWPLRISDVSIVSPDDYAQSFLDLDQLRSVLRVRIEREGVETLTQLQPRQLRFFLDPENGPAHKLRSLLSSHLVGIAVDEFLPDGQSHPRRLMDNCLRWCGFDNSEAMLPHSNQGHPAYRVLQEYFAFPEKFLFFEIDTLAVDHADSTLDILFLLDTPPDTSLRLTEDALLLNCIPLINLYQQRIDPLQLDHTQYEYRLTGDVTQHRNCEIYRLEQLQAIRTNTSPRTIYPCFRMDHLWNVEKQDYFYFTRREESHLPRTFGTEMYLSFVDVNFQLTDSPDEIIIGSALCTNRRMPERIRTGEILNVEGAAANGEMRVIMQPTAYQSPVLTGTRPWALVSQLSLNHLSLANGEDSLSALKALLRLHVGASSLTGYRLIDGLREIYCAPLVLWINEKGRRGYVQGLDIIVCLNHTHFNESCPILFAEILRRFFTLYAAVNTVIQFSVKLDSVKGVVKKWPPITGTQELL